MRNKVLGFLLCMGVMGAVVSIIGGVRMYMGLATPHLVNVLHDIGLVSLVALFGIKLWSSLKHEGIKALAHPYTVVMGVMLSVSVVLRAYMELVHFGVLIPPYPGFGLPVVVAVVVAIIFWSAKWMSAAIRWIFQVVTPRAELQVAVTAMFLLFIALGVSVFLYEKKEEETATAWQQATVAREQAALYRGLAFAQFEMPELKFPAIRCAGEECFQAQVLDPQIAEVLRTGTQTEDVFVRVYERSATFWIRQDPDHWFAINYPIEGGTVWASPLTPPIKVGPTIIR